MKKLSKLVLVELEKKELTQREMKKIRGGHSCTCACYSGGNSGSSPYGGSNTVANLDGNYREFPD
jgi:natural product precursor